MTRLVALARTPWALLALVVVGLALRLWAFGGVSFAHNSDDGRYAEVAQNLSAGHLPEGDAEWFGYRLTFLWPVALLFRVVGASDYSAVAWPLIGSLAAIVAAGLIGRELAGPRVGLVAAGLVAFAPLEVILGSRLRPDALMPAFVGLSVWAALRAGRGGSRALWWAAGAGALLGAGWFVRESIFVMAPIVVLAGWRAGPRALGAGAGGVIASAAAAGGLSLALGGSAARPFAAAPGQTLWRDPLGALTWDGAYLARAVRGALDPGHPLFLLLPVALAVAAVGLIYGRRDRPGSAAILVAAWAAWAALYLEFGTLVNLDKPLRFLTLASIPLALAAALAISRAPLALAGLALGATLLAAVMAAGGLDHEEGRAQDVVLLNRVVADLRDRPRAPVLAESFVWQRKLETWLADDRLRVRAVVDPMLLAPAERRARRRLMPLPDPTAYRGGYVVTAPVVPRRGWPANWGRFRQDFSRVVPWEELEPVATVGAARIYHWPVDVPPAEPRAGSA